MHEYYANEKPVLNSPHELFFGKHCKQLESYCNSGTPLASICYVQ